ncbi:MAG: Phosphoesterase RecJ domain protein [Candidatus Magasanikbacteria bacterium GW2011_GWA2_37_8]|uniref:Phosphoesterase RecJ domain protein n=1 Tax=Candidatus Magasanikbacteria bacterium GW2011_GWA2_37_8 TaxID=1619036 RepID=A0A0G0JVA0_9BACT|nr:MAG: Phosphoesterase RecJ domain protein [Candidatus Magasanikbacteria bacterium GW2011_GWA2_37_8]
MALDEIQQLQHLFTESKHVLLVFNRSDRGDALASALACKTFLEKQHKQADIVADDFVLSKNFSFLSGAEKIQPVLTHLQKFIIKVDVSKAPVETLSYDVKDGWLSIYLTPRQGHITKDELRTAQSTYKYDLIITFGVSDLESLGGVFLNNTDLFYRTPIINIDHQPNNEHFGQINLVEITATATAEIVLKTLKQLNKSLIDTPIATAILTGMIVATQSFKTPNVNPDTLNYASELINLGAKREEIVHNLYRTRTLSTLKLWGEALTNLNHDQTAKLSWVTIDSNQIARAGANEDELKDIIFELINSAPEAEMILLIYETKINNLPAVKGTLYSETGKDMRSLLAPWHGEGNKKQATFTITDKTLAETERAIVEYIKKTAI